MHDRHVLKAHMIENKKIKLEPTIYHCDKCKYKTKSKGNMKKHQSSQKHTLPKHEKPIHICQICKKKFKQRCKMQSHMQNCKYKNDVFIIMWVPISPLHHASICKFYHFYSIFYIIFGVQSLSFGLNFWCSELKL